MSHFICGEFVFKSHLPVKRQEELSFKLTEAALSNHFALQLGCNIVQDIVFEILKMERATSDAKELPFLVTTSPLADSSDGLISPYTLGLPPDLYYAKLEENLQRLKQFLVGINEMGVLSTLTVVFSEGFDDSYEEINTSLDSFIEQCINAFKKEEGVPSLRVRIQP